MTLGLLLLFYYKYIPSKEDTSKPGEQSSALRPRQHLGMKLGDSLCPPFFLPWPEASRENCGSFHLTGLCLSPIHRAGLSSTSFRFCGSSLFTGLCN